LKSQNTSLIVWAKCLEKKPNIQKKKPKSQTIFLTPTASKKSQMREIWRQKSQSGNPVILSKTTKLF